MYTSIFFATLCIALTSCCPGQAQTPYDQIQGTNSYLPNSQSRQMQHIHYHGPVIVHSYQRPHRYYRSRNEAGPGINQPYSGEYMTHLLLANQVPGSNNDNMAQLLYDNSAQPQTLSARDANQLLYDPVMQSQQILSARNAAQLMYDPFKQSQQIYARNMAPQSYLYPGLYTRSANNLDVYDDNEYVLVPGMTCLH